MTTEGLIFSAVVICVAAVIVLVAKRRFDGVAAAFIAVASTTGGEITERSFRRRLVEVVADLDGIRVVARFAGGPGLPLTTVWAECPAASGLEILVRRPERGHPSDGPPGPGAVEVVTNDEPRSRAWVGKATTAAMTKAPGYRFRMMQGRVEATRAGAERDPVTLVAAMRAVALFARGDGEPA